MRKAMTSYPGLAIMADLYLDRLVYATLIVAALFAGTYIYA
ncbi:MAG: hypothetical protein AAF771_06645 [Pseudomonadota bacterium]